MIYLFNNRDELIKIISREEIIDFTRKTEINSFDEAEFELDLKYDVEILNQARYFGFFIYNDIFKMFKITTKNLEKDRVIKGLDRAESDLNTVKIIKDRRLTNVTADQALTVALEDTGYEIGEVVDLPNVDKINYYYISPREALVKIIETFHCEFDVRYTFVNNKITSRYVDLFNKQGRKTGKQFYHGQDLLNIKSEEDDDKVITALIGRGKGEETDTGGFGRRIEFTDIVWEKSKGKPINKPSGQNYIVNEDAKAEFGLFQNGELRHRWGVFVDENIEDKEILLQKTYEELKRLSIPLTVYTASLVELGSDLKKGDTVAIIRDDLKIAFQARIHTLKIDMLNSERSTVELGDYETLKSKSNAANPTNQILAKVLDKQGQDIEAFNQRIEEEKKAKNAELDDRFRTVQLNIDNALEQAKAKAEVVKAEINSDIQSKLSPIQIDVQNFRRDFGGELIRLRNELIPNINQNTTDLTATKRRLTELFDQEQAKINDIKINNDGLRRQLNQSLESILADVNAFKNNASSKIDANQTSLTQIKTDLVQTNKGLTQLSQKTVDSQNRLTRNEADIRRLNDEVSSKVAKTDFDKVNNRLTTTETLVRQTVDSLISKVNRTDFDRISGRVSNAETGLTQVANEIKLKASKSDVDSLTGRVAKTESSIQVANDKITYEVGRVETNLSSIRTTLTQTANALETKVTKTDFDASNRRLSNAETQINTLAGSIETKLSSTQLTDILSSKGYQNFSQVNTLINQSAGNLRTTLSEVERKIPTEIGGPNLIKNGAFPKKIDPWSGNLKITNHEYYYNGNKTLFVLETFTPDENVTVSNRFYVKRNTDYTFSFYGFASWNVSSMDVNFLGRKNGETVEYSSVKEIVSKKRLSPNHSEYVSVTFNSGDNDNAVIRFDSNGSTNSSISWLLFGEVTLIEGRTSQNWSPSPEDLVTETKFNEVVDTVSSHTRTIGENSNKISQAIQTADSIRQSVSELSSNAIKQSDLSITSSGIVMRSGITDPKKSIGDLAAASFRLNPYQIDLFAEKIRVKGDMLVDGAITSQKIASGSVDTAQLRAGAVNTTILSSDAVTADKLRVDEALFNKLSAGEILAQKLFAKSAFITSVQSVDLSANRITSGMLRARNGAVNFNLDSGQLNFYTDAPALKRTVEGFGNQFLKFETGGYTKDGQTGYQANKTIIGSTRTGDESAENGSFTGLRIWNAYNQNSRDTADLIDIIGDKIAFQDSASGRTRSVWILETYNGKDELFFYPENANGKRHIIGHPVKPFKSMYAEEFYLKDCRLGQALKDIANRIGHNGWADHIG